VPLSFFPFLCLEIAHGIVTLAAQQAPTIERKCAKSPQPRWSTVRI
jgi:hypothetical protein